MRTNEPAQQLYFERDNMKEVIALVLWAIVYIAVVFLSGCTVMVAKDGGVNNITNTISISKRNWPTCTGSAQYQRVTGKNPANSD
jgi:hypothetical protein